jgi:hypothetical protein
MSRDYLKAGAMLAALVTMAPAEYELGHACGFGQLAAGLRASLDIYTLRAIRTGRDVPAVALTMIAVNAASHLIAAGHLAVTWYLIVAVSALPVLVLVRVERLGKGHAEPVAPAAELTDFLPGSPSEPAAVPAEPAPEPVVIERVTESEKTVADLRQSPTLGPMVPVAELLAGTSRDQSEKGPFVGTNLSPEPTETGRNLRPVPEPETGTSEVPPGVAVEHVEAAREWLATEPELTGTAIGTRLGTSDSYGRRVRRAALAVTV